MNNNDYTKKDVPNHYRIASKYEQNRKVPATESVWKMLPTKLRKNEIYYVTFEDYLQPRKPLRKDSSLLFAPRARPPLAALKTQPCKPDLRLKLLEHPVFVASEGSNKWQRYSQILRTKFCPPRNQIKIQPLQSGAIVGTDPEINDKTADIARAWWQRSKLSTAIRKYSSHLTKLTKLPNFLAFLRARNDDGLCKRKSGFEIYCELSSIHGFINFVDAKTWQRAFWCGVVCLAVLLSIIVLVMSHAQNVSTPTILYTESTTYPGWTIPFPAVTICNFNRISRDRAQQVARKFSLSAEQAAHFRFALYDTDNLNASESDFKYLQLLLDRNNYSLPQLRRDISPDCQLELLKCKWKGVLLRCNEIFQRVETPHSQCCSFNYHALKDFNTRKPKNRFTSDLDLEYSISCGYKTGLTILLDGKIADYMASSTKSTGRYQVFIHDAYDYPDNGVEHHIIQARTEAMIAIRTRNTYATSFVRGLSLHQRRCYLPNERELYNFRVYTQGNCLSECRSKLFVEKCACVPGLLPRLPHWSPCRPSQSSCILQNMHIFSLTLIKPNRNYKFDHYAEKFICDCFPPCEFNQYMSTLDSTAMNRTFTSGDRKFFKDIKLEDHTVLHVFYADLLAAKLRMDVLENWLTFIGTFGGITGLYMGYSFVSGFEMIFFVFVRPACNWLTRQQIRYRIKRRQQKAKAEAAKKADAQRQLQEQQTKPPAVNEKEGESQP